MTCFLHYQILTHTLKKQYLQRKSHKCRMQISMQKMPSFLPLEKGAEVSVAWQARPHPGTYSTTPLPFGESSELCEQRSPASCSLVPHFSIFISFDVLQLLVTFRSVTTGMTYILCFNMVRTWVFSSMVNFVQTIVMISELQGIKVDEYGKM